MTPIDALPERQGLVLACFLGSGFGNLVRYRGSVLAELFRALGATASLRHRSGPIALRVHNSSG